MVAIDKSKIPIALVPIFSRGPFDLIYSLISAKNYVKHSDWTYLALLIPKNPNKRPRIRICMIMTGILREF